VRWENKNTYSLKARLHIHGASYGEPWIAARWPSVVDSGYPPSSPWSFRRHL